MKSNFVGLFLLLGIVACGGTSPSDLDIVRGHPVGTGSPALYNTVSLRMGYSSCTGSIIGQRLILTAAHCVEDVQASEITVRFQRTNTVPAVDKEIAAVRVRTFKPEGAAFFPQFDIAWVELKENIPAPFKPMEILRDPSQLNTNTPVMLAGYGLQSDDCATRDCSGKLMEGRTELKNYYDKPHIMSLLVFHGDPKRDLSGACYGDSGGPAYVQVNNTWFIAGVTNGFTSNMAPEGDGSCDSGWDIYTFAGDYLPWLQKSSGYELPVAQASLNREREQPALVMAGPAQTKRPTTWNEWVNYANHEDAAWYTMESLLDGFASAKHKTEVLYDSTLSEEALTNATSLVVSSVSLKDLTPLSLFTKVNSLFVQSGEILDIRALESLPLLKDLSFSGINKAPTNVFAQIPKTKAQLTRLNLSNVSGAWLQGLNWELVANIPSLTIAYTDLDLTRFSAASAKSLTLNRVRVTGRFEPTVAPEELTLQRVVDQENRSHLDWLGAMPQLKSLQMYRLPADSLDRLGDFSGLTQLSLENMGITQNQLENLPLPIGLQRLGISGNRITSIPNGLAWKALKLVEAYDNPLINSDCPAGTCSFDKHMSPASMRDYCENTASTSYDYTYRLVVWAVMSQGPLKENESCETIEQAAAKVEDLNFYGSEIEDIRPVAWLSQSLKTLDLGHSAVTDLSPLSHMNRLAELYIEGIPANVDAAMFVNNPGLKIVGLKQNPTIVNCPIPAGHCYYAVDDNYVLKNGPLLGMTQVVEFDSIGEAALPGIGKALTPNL